MAYHTRQLQESINIHYGETNHISCDNGGAPSVQIVFSWRHIEELPTQID